MFIRERDTPATKQPLHLLQTLFASSAMQLKGLWAFGLHLVSRLSERFPVGADEMSKECVCDQRHIYGTKSNNKEGLIMKSNGLPLYLLPLFKHHVWWFTSQTINSMCRSLFFPPSLKFLINTSVILVLFVAFENLNSIPKPLFLAPRASDRIHSGD